MTKVKQLLEAWAVETLAGIGVSDSSKPGFEQNKNKIINQLTEVFSDKAIEKFLDRVDNRIIESADGFARITGPCGDTMEYYLKIDGDSIVDVSYQTDGCNSSHAAGGMTAEMARGLMISDAEKLSQQDVLDALGGLPEENQHCALLSTNTLKEAITNYRESALHA